MIRRPPSARPGVRHSPIRQALRRSRARQVAAWLAPRWLSVTNGLALVFLAVAMLISPQCRVEQVAVRRQSASSEAAVTRATQLSQVVGHNIFLVNTNRVAQELATIPSIRSVRVVPRLPNLVEIDIVERVPIAVWRTPSEAFLVDDQGYAMAPAGEAGAEPRPEAGRLTVNDTSGRTVRLGDRIDQRALLAARELVKAFPAAGAQVQAVEYGPQGLVLITDAGWRVIIGPPESLNAKLANFSAVADLARRQNLQLTFIDLRPKDRPFYQVAGAS
ncbi:MAG TPA: FtsQ-type POTRA domain-containing protein, partial [Chloroflexota bacterium]|nr:FtsQ-type POTRA domain-containing protein [Chloroflexota bacterium]